MLTSGLQLFRAANRQLPKNGFTPYSTHFYNISKPYPFFQSTFLGKIALFCLFEQDASYYIGLLVISKKRGYLLLLP